MFKRDCSKFLALFSWSQISDKKSLDAAKGAKSRTSCRPEEDPILLQSIAAQHEKYTRIENS